MAQTELQGLDQQVTELEAQQEKLTDSEQKLRPKIEAFRTKKEVIKAQYSAAEAQVRISEAATGVGEQMADVGLAMQRAQDKTEQMRARPTRSPSSRPPGTFDDLTTPRAGPGRHRPPARELATTSQVDDELAKMKAELGAAPAGHGHMRLGEGGSERDRSDLRRGFSTASTTGDHERVDGLDNQRSCGREPRTRTASTPRSSSSCISRA